jgi:hypothetical protein
MKCDICGDDLSQLGPLAAIACDNCDTELCYHCRRIHECEVRDGFLLEPGSLMGKYFRKKLLRAAAREAAGYVGASYERKILKD